MTQLIRRLAPTWVKLLARKTIKFFKYRYRRVLIYYAIRQADSLKLILGAAETYQEGWYSTNEQWLDITKPEDWKRIFNNKKLITHIVAEHVFEHLTREECLIALKNISDYLVDCGRIRIAVPDGYHPNESYLNYVGVGGIGDDASDHKQLLNIDTLSEILIESGFKPVHIEGYDSKGNLIESQWQADDGFIRRSRVNKANNPWGFIDADTSLIVDGIKQ